MKATVLAVLSVGATAFADPSATTAPVAGGETGGSPPSVTSHVGAPAPGAPRGLAVGVELGEPTSATIGWFTGKLAVVGGVGTGTVAGLGIQVHADVQGEVLRLGPHLPLRVGGGLRVYHHGYHETSIDEIPDTHLGVRASASLALERGALQLYVEIAPGIDVARSSSCSLASGARSICPHAMESPAFFQMAVGARWFLSP